MLSVDPTLSSDDVRDIIEGTADKVGGVTYGNVLPNGTWNQFMGYEPGQHARCRPGRASSR